MHATSVTSWSCVSVCVCVCVGVWVHVCYFDRFDVFGADLSITWYVLA